MRCDQLILCIVFLVNFMVTEVSGEDPPALPDLKQIEEGEPLAGTKMLDWEGDLAEKMVQGVHRFLDTKISSSKKKRAQAWR